jgi:hypothetical protein
METRLFQERYIKKGERWGEGDRQLIFRNIPLLLDSQFASFVPVL